VLRERDGHVAAVADYLPAREPVGFGSAVERTAHEAAWSFAGHIRSQIDDLIYQTVREINVPATLRDFPPDLYLSLARTPLPLVRRYLAGFVGLDSARLVVAIRIESEAATGNLRPGNKGKARGKGKPPLPRWDEERRVLMMGEKTLKTYKHSPAQNQIDVIEAFQRAGWAAAVDDPFEDTRTLNETIRALNKSMPRDTIRFRGDGTGERVVWEYAT
jgi:hypothetical protein